MLFPTAYFPSILYLKSLCQEKVALIDHHEHWLKQSIRNRCEILGSSGIQKLVIPIRHDAGKQNTGTMFVDDAKKWRENHWKSIKTAYGRSPFFEYYQLELEACIFCEEIRLVAINRGILNMFISAWELPISVGQSDAFIPYGIDDVRKQDWFRKENSHAPYQQVFQPKANVIYNASSLDLLCCEGPLGRTILLS